MIIITYLPIFLLKQYKLNFIQIVIDTYSSEEYECFRLYMKQVSCIIIKQNLINLLYCSQYY